MLLVQQGANRAAAVLSGCELGLDVTAGIIATWLSHERAIASYDQILHEACAMCQYSNGMACSAANLVVSNSSNSC